MDIIFNQNEIARLFDPAGTKGRGGFQSLLKSLQSRTDRASGALTLDDKDLRRIPQYAFNYGNGGWEGQLRDIFGRTLGSDLSGRQP